MVSNSLFKSVSMRYGFSKINTPSSSKRIVRPATKSSRLSIWAKVLVESMSFAGPLVWRIFSAVSLVKKILRVSTPLAIATDAILGAGSMPSAGIPSFLNALKKTPSLLPISITSIMIDMS